MLVKLAVTVMLPFMVTCAGFPVLVNAPVQPANL